MSRKHLPAVVLLALAAACDSNDSLPPVALKDYAVEPTVASLTLVQDDTLHIGALVRDVASNTTLPSTLTRVTFAAADPTIVDAAWGGAVRALKPGSTKIIATFRDEYGYPHSTSVPVTVSAMPLRAVVFMTSDTTIFLDETLSARAVAQDTSGANRPLRDISYALRDLADTLYASVLNGTVTPLKVGTVAVVATAEGKSDTLAVSFVQRPVATVTVAPATSTIVVGDTVQMTVTLKASNGLTLTDRTVTWSTSDDAVATVDTAGKVTAVSAPAGGTTVTITATSETKSGTAQVVVNP